MLGTVNQGAETARRSTCRGVSLVELMVGLALGLFIVAAALFLLSEHLRENRSLLLQARLQQDLRTTLDLMSRHLYRAGFWGTPQAAIWQTDTVPQTNPYSLLMPNGNSVLFHASRDAQENQQVDSNESLGFRLQRGVLQMQLGAGGWQSLTDPEVMRITQLQIQPHIHEQTLADLCHRPCPPASTTCPPRQQVRSMQITLQASATHDAQVQRSLQTQVRLRNDAVHGSCHS
jgi:prepilin peptidase dependent protein B